MQKAALALLPTLVPTQLPELWPDLILTLLHLIRPDQLQLPTASDSLSPAKVTTGNINKHALSSLMQERVVGEVAQLYRWAATLLHQLTSVYDHHKCQSSQRCPILSSYTGVLRCVPWRRHTQHQVVE